MGDTVTIQIDGDASGFKAGTEEVKRAVKGMGDSTKRASEGVKRSVGGAMQAAGKIGKTISGGIGKVFNGITGFFSKTLPKLSNGVKGAFGKMESSSKGLLRTVMRLGPGLIGVTGAYQMISRATQQFMSENQALGAQMTAVWSGLGNLIGPIISQLVSWLSQAVAYLLQFLSLLGVASASAKKAGAAAGGGAAELKRTIAGFDELNLLQDQGGGGGGGAQGKLPEVELSEFMKKLAEALKQGMWDKAADMIIDKFNGLIKTFHDKAYEFGKKAGYYLTGAFTIIGRVLNETNWHMLGGGIAQFFNGILEQINADHTGRHIGETLVAGITIGLKIVTGFLEELNPSELATTFTDIVTGALDALSTAIEGADWEKIGNNIIEFLTSVDWGKIADSLGRLLKGAWDAAWGLFLGLLGSGTENELPIVQQFRDLKQSIEDLGKAAAEALGPVWNDVLKPMLEYRANVELPNTLKLIKTAVDDLTTTLQTFKDIWEGIKAILNGDADGGFAQIASGADNFNQKISALSSPMTAFLRWAGLIKPTAEEAADGANTAAEAATNMATAVDAAIESTTSGNSDSTQGTSVFADVASDAGEAQTAIEGVVETESGVVLTAEAITAVAEAASDASTKVDEASQKVGEVSEQWVQLQNDITATMEGINTAVTEQFDAAKETVDEKTTDIKDALSKSLDEMAKDVDTKLTTVANSFESILGGIASSASGWGVDLMSSFISGIESMQGALEGTLSNVAGTVDSYIGFSEPEKGPLSNFHTFAPDMMKLFSDGIKKNIGLVGGAVSNVAQNVSDGFNGIDVPEMIGKLGAAGTVAYRAPAVATGTVMPYGVSSMGMASGFGGDSGSFLETLGQRVYSAVSMAMSENNGFGGDVRTAVFNIDSREFMRATFNSQRAVANEHGVSLVIK